MKEFNLIMTKIEEVFNILNISYEYLEIDDDINYMINFNTYGRLKSLDTIRGFVYFRNADFTMNFIVLNIYNLDDENIHIDTLDIYEIINEINSFLLLGCFIFEKNKHILYRSSIICGHDYEAFNDNMLKKQINVFINGLNKLFIMIKDKGKNIE